MLYRDIQVELVQVISTADEDNSICLELPLISFLHRRYCVAARVATALINR